MGQGRGERDERGEGWDKGGEWGMRKGRGRGEGERGERGERGI